MKLYQLKISSVNKKCLLLYVSFLLKIFHFLRDIFKEDYNIFLNKPAVLKLKLKLI